MATLYDDEEDDDSPDDPQEEDQDPSEYDDDDDDDQVDQVPCPYCGKPVYERAEVCPHCRSYISREDAPRSPSRRGVPLWVWVGAALVMAVVVTWVVKKI
jgi:hypothetical protein